MPPALGCLTCRRRRVKCDLTRPVCLRCQKSERKCLGFQAEESGIQFKSENYIVSNGLSRRPLRKQATQLQSARGHAEGHSQGRKPQDDTAKLNEPLPDVAQTHFKGSRHSSQKSDIRWVRRLLDTGHRDYAGPPKPDIFWPLSLHNLWQEDEKRGLSYFMQRVVPQHGTLDCDLSFFSTLVPRLAESDSAIRHLIVSMAALNEVCDFYTLESVHANQLKIASMEHYSKATEILRNSLQTLPKEVAITSSILLYFLETIKGNQEAAQNVAQISLAMSKNLNGDILEQRWDTKSPNADTSSCRISIDSMQAAICGTRQYKLWEAETLVQTATVLDLSIDPISGPLTSLMDIIMSIANLVFPLFPILKNLSANTYINPSSPWPILMSKQFTTYKHFWSKLQQHSPALLERVLPNNQWRLSYNLILESEILLHCRMLASTQCIYDNYTAHFRQINEAARLFTANESEIDPSRSKRLVWTPTIDVPTTALWLTASSCRDPQVRREAISILRMRHRREGYFDSHILAELASLIITIEERGLTQVLSARDIPESKRIRLIEATMVPKRREIRLIYTRLVEDDMGNRIDQSEKNQTAHLPLREIIEEEVMPWTLFGDMANAHDDEIRCMETLLAAHRTYDKSEPGEARGRAGNGVEMRFERESVEVLKGWELSTHV